MKWITKDCYGDQQVWYSGDVIEKILQVASDHSCEFCDDLGGCADGCIPVEIRRIIAEED